MPGMAAPSEHLDADAIDRLVAQWAAERPDLNLDAMATILRVVHLGGRVRALLVPSGTMTSRLDKLEAKGAIERVPHPTDRRSVEVQLTDGARERVDAAVTAHVAREVEWLSVLTDDERAGFDAALRKLLTTLPQPGR